MSYLAAKVVMVAVKVHQHFIVYQFGDAARILPIDTQPDIGLLQLIKIVVDDNVCTALQSIFNEFFDTG